LGVNQIFIIYFGAALKKIKVVHLVAGSLNGGAARGAYWLHKGLLGHGVESHVITNHHDDLNDPTVTSLSRSKFKRVISLIVGQLDPFLLLIFPKRKKEYSAPDSLVCIINPTDTLKKQISFISIG
jgi:hypothetical protein